MPVGKVDASVQAVLCTCGSSDVNTSILAARDACEQTALCGCSEFVSGMSSTVSLDSGVGATLDATAPSPSPPESSHVPVTAASDKATTDNGNKKDSVKVEDIDAICKEMAECDLEDTVLYEYESENKRLVGGSGDGVDHTDLLEAEKARVVDSSTSMFLNDSRKAVCNEPSAVSVGDEFTDDIVESVSATATACEPDDTSVDCSIVIMHSVSLQTSVVGNAAEVSVGRPPDLDTVSDDDLLPSHDETRQSPERASATCLVPPLLSGDGATIDHSSANQFSDSCEKNSCSVSLDTSDDILELECASATTTAVRDPGANSCDSVVNMQNVSMPTSAAEKVIEVNAGRKPGADTVGDHVPLFEQTVESTETFSATFSLPLRPSDNRGEVNRSSAHLFSDSCKMSSCDAPLDSSVDTDMTDDVFESRSATKVGSESVEEMGECTHEMEADLLLDDSIEKIICRSPADDETYAARKILTSTALGNPAAIDDFFGLAGSSLSSSSEPSSKWSVDSGRRKSKPGKRRVSMCGEYEDESPTQFFTPSRNTVATDCQLTVIADTDEEEDSPTRKSVFYTTAVDEHLLDTVLESDEDCTRESVEPAIEGCIPDSPIAVGQPVTDQLSEMCPSSHSSEHIFPNPTEDGHFIPSPSESSHAEGIEHFQSESVLLASSKRNLENDLEDCVTLDEDDDKNRYHVCRYFFAKFI